MKYLRVYPTIKQIKGDSAIHLGSGLIIEPGSREPIDVPDNHQTRHAIKHYIKQGLLREQKPPKKRTSGKKTGNQK